MATQSRQSLLSRKLDLLYFVFFVVHLPVLLFIDLVPFYPEALVPSVSSTLRKFYIDTYRDQFFINPTLWFKSFAFLELIYHLPITLWFIPALIRDDVLVPLHLLVFASETGLTTLVCVVETYNWKGYTKQEVQALFGLYLPYLAVAILMGFDAFYRVKRIILAKPKQQ